VTIKNALIIRQILKAGGRCEDMKFSLIYKYLPREGEEPGNARQEHFACFLKPEHDDIYQSPYVDPNSIVCLFSSGIITIAGQQWMQQTAVPGQP